MARRGERAMRLQADTFERLVLGQLHETVGPQAGDLHTVLPHGWRRRYRG